MISSYRHGALKSLAVRAVSRAHHPQQFRSISVGTNLMEGETGEVTWQKARPWDMDGKSSNVAKDMP
jgi:hypothetical protein